MGRKSLFYLINGTACLTAASSPSESNQSITSDGDCICHSTDEVDDSENINQRPKSSNYLRISTSPLHRGVQCGSPAFRRKRRRLVKSDSNTSVITSGYASTTLPSCRTSSMTPTSLNANPKTLRKPLTHISVKACRNPLTVAHPPLRRAHLFQFDASTLKSASEIQWSRSATPPLASLASAPTAKFRSDGEISLCNSQQDLISATCGRHRPEHRKFAKTKILEKAVIEHDIKSQCQSGGRRRNTFFHKRSLSFNNFFHSQFNELRRSFSWQRRESPSRTRPFEFSSSQDWKFFRGFSGKRREDLQNDEPISHNGPWLTISPPNIDIYPPRRCRPPRSIRRTMSLTDAHFIAQALLEGDLSLLDELYPGFPKSQPPHVYKVRNINTRSFKSRRPHSSTVETYSKFDLTSPAIAASIVDRFKSTTKTAKSCKIYESINSTSCSEASRVVDDVAVQPSFIIPTQPKHATSLKTEIYPHVSSAVTNVTTERLKSQPKITVSFNIQGSNNFTGIQRSLSSLSNDYSESRASTVALEGTSSLKSSCVPPCSLAYSSVNSHYTKANENRTSSVNDSVIISPWNNRFDSTEEDKCIIPCRSNSNINGHLTDFHHPFTKRTQLHYARRQHLLPSKQYFQVVGGKSRKSTMGGAIDDNANLTSSFDDSSSGGGGDLMTNQHIEASFREIMATADDSILQAESILSSMQRETATVRGVGDNSSTLSSETSSCSLGSSVDNSNSSGSKIAADEIDRNIRLLEDAQLRITTALTTFRSARDAAMTTTSSKSFSHLVADGKTSSLKLERQISAPTRVNLSSNTTIKLKPMVAPNTSTHVECNVSPSNSTNSSNRCRKTSLFRRHSFNLLPNKERGVGNSSAAPSFNHGDSTTIWYDREVPGRGSFSDSEGAEAGGSIPLRKRIRGLLGSFGKGKCVPKKEQRRQQRSMEHLNSETNNYSGEVCNGNIVRELTRRIDHLSTAKNDEMEHHSTKGHLLGTTLSSCAPPNVPIKTVVYSESSGEEEREKAPVNEDVCVHDKKVYYIAREIMTSEFAFVDVLHLINVEFREFISKQNRKGSIIPESDVNRIFSNLSELQKLNESLLRDFQERIENWHNCQKIADVIVHKGHFLKLYTIYIREFSHVMQHFDDCCQKYAKFAKLVDEFEKHDRCKKLRIKHYMLKPVQRLPQYKLLLEDYLKHLDPEGVDFDDTTNALRIVSEAAQHANETIRQADKFRQMMKLQARLQDFELIKPGRELIKEGELQKISRKGGLRYLILLSDCLLYTTYVGGWAPSEALRFSYSIPLEELQVRMISASPCDNSGSESTSSSTCSSSCDFYIVSPLRSCTLRANSVSERIDWVESINSTIEEHVSNRATFATSSYDDPGWFHDSVCCQNCLVEFNELIKRNHCRACGKVVCSGCFGNKAPLKYNCKEHEVFKVCDHCYQELFRDLGHVDKLRAKFKKRENIRLHQQHIPSRLRMNASVVDAQMSGYLKQRQQQLSLKWRRMWFLLKDRVLYAYKSREDLVAIETFPVLGFDISTLSDKNMEFYEGELAVLIFQLTHVGRKPLVFCAENGSLCERWISALQRASRLDES